MNDTRYKIEEFYFGITDNENASVANPDHTPRIASVHKAPFAVVVLVECWIETVYYYVKGKTLGQLLTSCILLNVGCMAYVTHVLDTRSMLDMRWMRAVVGKILAFLWEKCVTSW